MSQTIPSYHSYSLDKTNDKIVVDKSLNFLYDPNKHPPLSFTETVTSLFNTTSLLSLIGFLAIYFAFYLFLGKFYGPFTPLSKLKGQAINFACLFLFIIGGIYFYYSLPKDKQDNFVKYVMLLFQDEMNDPNTIFIMIEFIIIFYIIVSVLNLPMGHNEKPFALHIIEIKSWLYLAMLIIIVFFIYVLNIEIVDLVYFEWYRLIDFLEGVYKNDEDIIKTQLYSSPTSSTPSTKDIAKKPTSYSKLPESNLLAPTIGPAVNGPAATSDKICHKASKAGATPAPNCPVPPSEIKEGSKEVFNVSNNLYTYDDAQAICKAYGARLANYEEIEEAYEAGAEWCNYGWSEGQMAYFPTQKKTWDSLQKDPATKHNCGRPGINGGFINNPYIKFGVNCYGVKPPPNELEKNIMNANKAKPDASCPAAPKPDPNVEKWKQQLDSLVINSYNNADWSQYS